MPFSVLMLERTQRGRRTIGSIVRKGLTLLINPGITIHHYQSITSVT